MSWKVFDQNGRLLITGTGAPNDAQFVVVSADPTLTQERVLTSVAGETVLVDYGANNPITVGLADTTVLAGIYGTSTSVSQVTFDAKGRAILAVNVPISITALLPSQVGHVGEFLSTDGFGVLSWLPNGSGTVTSFSSGNLSPLFTTSVATPTTTPALSFALSSAGANTYFGNATGLSASPSHTSAGALTKVDDTNVTLTLSANAPTSLLQAVSLTIGWSGQLGLSRGGTNASLTASNGSVVYSTAVDLALTAVGISGQVLTSSGAGAPIWTTPTTGTVTGTGTANTISKFTGVSSIGDSTITDNGTTVNIGSSFLTWSGTSATFTPTGNFIVDLSSGINMNVIGDDKFKMTNSGGFTATIANNLLTASRIYTLPNVAGTVALINGGQTFTSATWNASVISEIYGGTNQSSYATGDILYASAANILSKLAIGTAGQVLTVSGGVPTWVNPASSGITTTLFSQYTSVTVANTTTETTLIGTGSGSTTLSANYFANAGDTLVIKAKGYYTKNNANGITIKFKLGGTTYISAQFTSGDISSSATQGSFEIDILATCYSTGAGGTLFVQGHCFFIMSGGGGTAVRTSTTVQFQNTATQAIDTTTSKTVDITAQWAAANANLSITMTNLQIKTS